MFGTPIPRRDDHDPPVSAFSTTASSEPWARRTWMAEPGGAAAASLTIAGFVRNNRVAALQNPQRAQLRELGRHCSSALRRRARPRRIVCTASAWELPCAGDRRPAADGHRNAAAAPPAPRRARPPLQAGAERSRRRYSCSSMRCKPRPIAPVEHAQRPLDALLPQPPLQHRQPVPHRLRALSPRRGDAVQQFLARADDHLGGGRRRGRAQIGHEIGDGHVGLVAHRRDHRHGASGDGPRHGLFVEGPEIFERSAAAAHDHQLRPAVRLK